MKKGLIPLMIINWIWYLSTTINKEFNWIHYSSLILGCIVTMFVFWENKKC